MKLYPKFLTSNLLSVLIGASVSMVVNLIPEAVDDNPYIWGSLFFFLVQVVCLLKVFKVRESVDSGVKTYMNAQLASYIKQASQNPKTSERLITPEQMWNHAVEDEKLTFYSVLIPVGLFVLSIVVSGFLVKLGYEYSDKSKNQRVEHLELGINEISTTLKDVQLKIETHVMQSKHSQQALSDSLAIYNEHLQDVNKSLKGLRKELRSRGIGKD